ncbi:unnamed protein product, partial [Mesorhabditis belari]|uniref:Glutathione peroxidase n=1 Tax=Mesorhabditis belari TaxID=2138241 RepID=A0AAF3FGP0_9BILA
MGPRGSGAMRGRNGPFRGPRQRSFNNDAQYGYALEEPKKEAPPNKKTKFAESEDEEEDVKPNSPNKAVGGDEDGKLANRRKFENSHRKPWRLIVRNLNFNTKVADLQNAASKFGPFTEIVLPKCKDERYPNSCAGFAFIQFKDRETATKFKEHYNQNPLNNRPIAVDFALDKDTYATSTFEERKNMKTKVKDEENEDQRKNVKKQEKSEPVDEEESDETIEESEDEDESMDDEDEDEGKSDEESPKKGTFPKKPRKEDTAIAEGRVLFVRNLSFDTVEESLEKEMVKFGEVKLVIICKFADSGHSKGTAFVHFSAKEEADKCLRALMGGTITIDGRTLGGFVAIPRGDAQKIEKEHLTKAPKDKRNLHLLRAGWIREGTSAAAGMSEKDAQKRVQLTAAAKKKLENLHHFVSPTRLVVHNLPMHVDDKGLKKLCQNAAGRVEAMVIECRIWRDMGKLDSNGKPKSRGFGFVAFSEHVDALACLNKLNNNPKIFTNDRRPIVEFSIENLEAVKIKERRKLKSDLGRKVNEKELQAHIKTQVDQSKKAFSKGGQKPIPKFLGPKMRHRDQTKKGATKKSAGKKKKKEPTVGGGDSAVKRAKKKTNKKEVTKYLAFDVQIVVNGMLQVGNIIRNAVFRGLHVSASTSQMSQHFYDFQVKDSQGNPVKLGDKYRGKVVIVVNVASECGLTNANYTQLKEALDKYHNQGLEVAAFPCNQFGGQEPKCELDIKNFVANKFAFEPDLFGKVNVNGNDADPLWKFLKKEQGGTLIDAIKWNFTKFLVDREGNIIKRYAPTHEPKDMVKDIEKALSTPAGTKL